MSRSKVPEVTGQNQNPVKKGKVEEGAKMRMRVREHMAFGAV
jgi:hypothetical protein